MSETRAAVVLAAGKGTRMQSQRAKVLHELDGKPLVAYPLAAAAEAGVSRVVVVTGHAEAEVRRCVESSMDAMQRSPTLAFVHQAEQLGTGHAVSCALPELPREGLVLILSGDVPLLRGRTLRALIDACERSAVSLAVGTFEAADPTGYGRVERDGSGCTVRIVEERDCDATRRAITECNSGTYCVGAGVLHEALPKLGRDNAQGEMYLTDLVEVLSERGEVATVEIEPIEAAGVNTPRQLAELEAALRAP